MSEELEKLKDLLYTNSITQYGKRKLIKTYEDIIKEKNKQIDLMAENIELQQYANINTTNLDLICKKLQCNKKCRLVNKDCIKKYFKRINKR